MPVKYTPGFINTDGYRIVFSNGKRYRLSRLLMEEHLGRPLLRSEIVHHINGDKLDDRIENYALTDRTEHPRLHVLDGQWARHYDRCQKCGDTTRRHLGKGLCSRCYNATFYPTRR